MKTFLFDLDGTLLPMDVKKFIEAYSKAVGKHFMRVCNPLKFVKVLWDSTGKMYQNDGSKTNEEVFWEYFNANIGKEIKHIEPLFETFYLEQFDKVKSSCGYNPYANQLIKYLKSKGYRIVIATNPLFPKIGTMKRMKWAGLDPNDFELITTYEDFHYAKPNLKYYEEILAKIGEKAENCIMVGNDTREDMCVNQLGMEFILVTDDLINKDELTPECIFEGSLEETYKMIVEKY